MLMSTSKNESENGTSIIGLLVQDHPGVMMKITGMFARRGYNIASITVGHSERPGLSRITIGAEGDVNTIEQIIKQLNKLIEVVKVQHLVSNKTTMREIALIKVAIKDSNIRQQVITLIDLYKGKAVDISQKTITIEVVGNQTKIDSLIEIISDVTTIREIARSGTIAISRGDESITLN
jgi:acetolactate synthase-1/3 small subunit